MYDGDNAWKKTEIKITDVAKKVVGAMLWEREEMWGIVSMRIKRDQATVVSDGFDTFIDMHVQNVQTTMADAHYNVPF